jgi:hypothetical protein
LSPSSSISIPAAAEIREKGLNLGEFQIRLLEKVEELTLYAVQQERTIREQRTTIDSKEARISSLEARLAAIELMLLRQQHDQQK